MCTFSKFDLRHSGIGHIGFTDRSRRSPLGRVLRGLIALGRELRCVVFAPPPWRNYETKFASSRCLWTTYAHFCKCVYVSFYFRCPIFEFTIDFRCSTFDLMWACIAGMSLWPFLFRDGSRGLAVVQFQELFTTQPGSCLSVRPWMMWYM